MGAGVSHSVGIGLCALHSPHRPEVDIELPANALTLDEEEAVAVLYYLNCIPQDIYILCLPCIPDGLLQSRR